MKHRKQAAQKAVRTTVSMPMASYVKATERQQRRGHNTFSAYIQFLVHRDATEQEIAA